MDKSLVTDAILARVPAVAGSEGCTHRQTAFVRIGIFKWCMCMCVCVWGGNRGSQGLRMPSESLQVLDHQTVSCMTLTQTDLAVCKACGNDMLLSYRSLVRTVSEVKADVYVVSVCRHVTSETESALLNVFRSSHFT